jgi:SAM-dependent methyltransferase
MSLVYRLAYRLGIMPWDAKDPASLDQISALLDREEQGRTEPWGRALDIGCGTGRQSVELARRGWQVTGVDAVPTALQRASDRALEAGVEVDLVEADVTRLSEGVHGSYRFALDVGCFHGLDDDERQAYGRELTRVTRPDSALLLLAFSPGRRGPLPRGADRAGLERALPGWSITDEDPLDTSSATGAAAKASPRWYRLVRG